MPTVFLGDRCRREVWGNLRRDRDDELVLKLADVVILTDGRATRWLFTGREGTVLRKNDASLSPTNVGRTFNRGASREQPVAVLYAQDGSTRTVFRAEWAHLWSQGERCRGSSSSPLNSVRACRACIPGEARCFRHVYYSGGHGSVCAWACQNGGRVATPPAHLTHCCAQIQTHICSIGDPLARSC